MAIIAVQATLRSTTNLPEDDAVNTFHYQVDGPLSFGIVTNAVADAYVSNLNGILGGINRVRVVAYDLADAEPREPQNEQLRTMTSATPAPREVALCLSYFADRNLPRQRGRVYIGPFSNGGPNGATGDRPQVTLQNLLLDFGDDLAGSAGAGPTWGVYSPTDGVIREITDTWVDNEWDTMRSRGQKGTSRVMRSV
jgi:hypothetical protein